MTLVLLTREYFISNGPNRKLKTVTKTHSSIAIFINYLRIYKNLCMWENFTEKSDSWRTYKMSKFLKRLLLFSSKLLLLHLLSKAPKIRLIFEFFREDLKRSLKH